MNLVLHGLFFQVIVSIVQFQYGSTLCSAGEPGYLDFDNLPETNFSCQGKVIGGYYADVEAGCQMFHVCTIGQKDEIMDIKFLCLNGTVFDQETRVCERVDEVDCSKSERFYNLNLELYGNNAVTLSLHDLNPEEEEDGSEVIEESHESQRTSSSRPSTTSTTTTTTTTTTQRPPVSSTTAASGAYQHPNGYPQHYQPQPRFPPSSQTSQSKSLYDDKNGGYHHQYIYHTGDHRTNNLDNGNDASSANNQNPNANSASNNNNNHQATSYQLFSNQGVGSTTGSPQGHQIRYSSTAGPQIQIRNDHQPTVAPIFHATSSTIQTLLNSNANSPALINPIFHNHGIASTTEQFTVHNNNPRETDEYRDSEENDNDNEESQDDRRPLEPLQPADQGKVSKLKISPISVQQESLRNGGLNKQEQLSNEPQRITSTFLDPNNDDPQTVRSFYPTPRTSTKSSSSRVTQHIHVPPLPSIPQLKPHQVTINLSPPDIQRIVQNPSPLLPSQSRVIVTAKASVSDESGRPLNSTQLVTLPLPTIPASYDDYKEGDESFDPFYRDVPKIRNDRRAGGRFHWPTREFREKRSTRTKRDSPQPHERVEDTKIQEKLDGHSDAAPEIVRKDETTKYLQGHVDDRSQETGNTSDVTFNRKIFDDPDAQTSKDVDTRAIAHDSKFSKDLNNRYEDSAKKSAVENSENLESSAALQDDESSRFSLQLPEVVGPEAKKASSKKLDFSDHSVEENTKIEGNMTSEESSRGESDVSDEEYSNDDYYYDGENDSSSPRSDEDDPEDSREYSPNKIHSSRHDKSLDRDKVSDEKFKDENYQDDYEAPDASTTRSNEQVTSFEVSNEYADTEQTSRENSREDDEQDVSMSQDSTTTSHEVDEPEQVTSPSNEESDGVLKFTDEIPIIAEEMDEPDAAKRSGRPDAIPHDYIDDNYEPQSYKENGETPMTTGISAFFEEITTMKTELTNLEDEETSTMGTTSQPVDNSRKEKDSQEEKLNDEPRLEQKFDHENQVEKSIQEPNQIQEIATPSPVPMNVSSSLTSTTSTTTSTTSTTTPKATTTRAKTTTTRPTSPKLFKPFTLRKSYVYVPPSTTPVPVVIKPRLALLNPKPAKPPKSYNDLAPKPVIRKTLFTRKFPPTVRLTTPQDEDVETSTEMTPSTEKSIFNASSSELPAEPDRNVKIEANEIPTTTQTIQTSSTIDPQHLTPWPLLKTNQTSSTSPEAIGDPEQLPATTTSHLDLENNDVPNVREPEIANATLEPSIDPEIGKSNGPTAIETSTARTEELEKLQIEPSSDSNIFENNVAVNDPKPEMPILTTDQQVPTESTTTSTPPGQESTTPESATLVSVQTSSRKPGALKRIAFFNCLDKEMYRFYADGRDCRLFHYCSPGFTSRQVLDFRFVCEEGTAFDEESQSCVHDLNNPKCRKRVW